MRLKTVFRVTLVYLMVGLLWIFLSDTCIDFIANDDVALQSKLQTGKGAFYIIFTSVLLYLLISRYNKELLDKISLLKKSEDALKRSEEDYRTFFESSPIPVFICNPGDRKILAVNPATVEHYQYTKTELYNMSISDLEHEADVDIAGMEEKLHVHQSNRPGTEQGIHRHKRKNGDFIFVYTQSNSIHYNGTTALIILANDITQQLQYIDAIELQNKKLNDIAWQQSHVVRAPLASMMGLLHLLKETDNTQKANKEIVEKILQSAEEVDKVIKDISGSAGTISIKG